MHTVSIRCAYWIAIALLLNAATASAYAAPENAVMEELSGKGLHAQQPITFTAFRGSKLLVVLWRSDCTPCMTEMPAIVNAATAHPHLQVALLALEDAATARAHLHVRLPANVHVLVAQHKGAAMLSAQGDSTGMLPFSQFLHADGKLCQTHIGILGTDRINQWIQSC